MTSASIMTFRVSSEKLASLSTTRLDPPPSHSVLGIGQLTPDSSVSPGPGRNTGAVDKIEDSDDLDLEGVNDELRSKSGSPHLLVERYDNPNLAIDKLACEYLPALFRAHGPLAIRHITSHLTTNVPTFADLAQGKQRRLVVRALEMKKGFLFEKVGWGRWSLIDQKPDLGQIFTPESLPTNPGSLLSLNLTQGRPPLMGSYPTSSFQSSNEFLFSPVCYSTTRDDDDFDVDPLVLDDGDDVETDEEDWKAIGLEGLRQRKESVPLSASPLLSARNISAPYPIRKKSSAGTFSITGPLRPSFPKSSPIRTRNDKYRDSDADSQAVEALFMLSGSWDAQR